MLLTKETEVSNYRCVLTEQISILLFGVDLEGLYSLPET